MNVYRHAFAARCPNNDATITYSLKIRSRSTIMAEAIVEACKFDIGFHEDIAETLHARLGGAHRLKAHHHGVDIETRLGKPGQP